VSAPLRTVPTTQAAGPAALAAAGICLLVHPAVRPWAGTSPDRAADAFADPAWEPAHLLAVAAFVLLPLGSLALRAALAGTPGPVPPPRRR
jgi:hypothetical protein